jgi:hypothetical protein
MKVSSFLLALGILTLYSCAGGFQGSERVDRTPDFRNFYGIVWVGSPHDNLAFARQMGYDYVFYQKGMEKDSLSKGLYFYIETPEYSIYNRNIDTQKAYTAEEVSFAETHFALMNNTRAFPGNIARGWFFNHHTFTAQLDLQQQKVITWAIDSIISYVKTIEDQNPGFRFGGYAWDVPQPPGDFWDTIQNPGRQITLAHWTGGDFGIRHPDVIHDFETYSEGRINFYKQLYRATKEEFPHARFMMEPYRIYEDWIRPLGDREDAGEVTPDILTQERFGTEFADDERIFQSGLIDRQHVASTTPDRFGDEDNRLYAASAALNGSWYSWYGRFGGTGDMPGFRSIREVPARLKLIRMLANWENLNQTPLTQRTWDGNTYRSPSAFASQDVIALKQPFTNKLFVVFLSEKGKAEIPRGYKIVSAFNTDELFVENEDATGEIKIESGTISPADGNSLNKGYVLHLK